MKYYQQKKKPLNYFERQQQKLHPKKYRFFFPVDYPYYRAQKVGTLGSRGLPIVMSYWVCTFLLPIMVFEPFSMFHGTTLLVIDLAFLFVIPIAFCLLRYTSDREAALMKHYRRSAWNNIIPTWLVFAGGMVIGALEFWVMKGMGWI